MGVIRKAFYNLSIVPKIAATLFIISTLSVLTITLIHIWQTKQETDALVDSFIEINIRGNEGFIVKSIFADDRWALYKFIKSIAGNDFVIDIGLIDPLDRVIVHTDTANWQMDAPFSWPEESQWVRIELAEHEGAAGTFIVRKNENHLNELVVQTVKRSIAIFVMISIVSIALGLFISGRIVGRLKLLLSNIDAILDKRWEKIGSTKFYEQDEITHILKSFYKMATELKTHIEKLDETNRFYRDILSQIDTTVLICSAEFQPLFTNKGQVGPNHTDPGLDALLSDHQLLDEIKKLKDGNLQKELRLEGRMRSRHLIATISRLNDRWLITFANITRVRELEEQFMMAQTLSLVGELSAGLSHELKNLILPLRLLLDGNEPPSSEDLKTIQITTDKMNHLISSFLNFAKPPSQDERREVRLVDLVDEIMAILSNRIASRDIHLIRSVDPRLQASINTKAFEIVLINLLINAMEASYEGGSITVTLLKHDTKNLKLSVNDQGSGIDPKIIKRIHEPFFTTKSCGTGLGLSTVYRIVYDMGGYIQVSSDEAGTTFDIYIPTDKEI